MKKVKKLKKVKQICSNVLYGSVLLFLSISECAGQAFVSGGGARSKADLGMVADNLTNTSDVFKSVLNAVFYSIGVVFVFGGIIRYFEHRKNPSQTPISKVVFLLLAGLAIGFFPFVASQLGNKIGNSVGGV